MSQERKILKILCFLLVICAVALVAVGVLTLTGAGETSPEAQPWAIGLGAWALAEGVLGVLLAGAGIRGANTPRRAAGAKVPGIVASVLAAGGLVASVACPAGPQVATLAVAIPALLLCACCTMWSGKVDEQAQR